MRFVFAFRSFRFEPSNAANESFLRLRSTLKLRLRRSLKFHHSSSVEGKAPRRFCLPSPREELQLRCAGLVSPRMSPPRLIGTRWSSVKASRCSGGRRMSMGSPQSQQVASSGFFSRRRRSRATRFFQARVCMRGLWFFDRGVFIGDYRFRLSPGHKPVVR